MSTVNIRPEGSDKFEEIKNDCMHAQNGLFMARHIDSTPTTVWPKQ